MAAGQAERHWRETGRQVVILDQGGHPRWSSVWEGNPAILRDWPPKRATALVDGLVNAPGARPYLKYPWSRRAGVRFTDWRAEDYRGRLYLSEIERGLAVDAAHRLGRFAVLEPNLAATGNPNKAWIWERWVKLASQLWGRGLAPVQLGPAGTKALPGAVRIETPTFRLACAVLSAATVAVLPEGGLHHAAAALSVPAVVIFGGHTPVETTGYRGHVNIARAPACGRWSPCSHCKRVMASISVEEVEGAVADLLARLDMEAAGVSRPLAAGVQGRDAVVAAEGVRGGCGGSRSGEDRHAGR